MMRCPRFQQPRPIDLDALVPRCRQKWCPEYEAGLFKTIVEHTAAKLFDAATQDRSTTDTTMRVGV